MLIFPFGGGEQVRGLRTGSIDRQAGLDLGDLLVICSESPVIRVYSGRSKSGHHMRSAANVLAHARPSYPAEQKDGTKVNASSMLFTARFDSPNDCRPRKRRMGDEGKAVGT
jgi:hypothetical protein